MTADSLYLASSSPRRREILQQLGVTCRVLPQHVDETRRPGESPGDYVCRLARTKAEAALATLAGESGAAVLGSDTTVVCADEIFEKPVDGADALRILKALSGRTHQVLTAVALATAAGTRVLLSTSEVTFRPLSDGEIRAYWETGEPADKAGAYGIQGLGALFVKEIKGSYSGIMGLPVLETATLLAGIGLDAKRLLEARA